MSSALAVGDKGEGILQGFGIQLESSDKLNWGLYFSELELSQSSELAQALIKLSEPWARRFSAMQVSGKNKGFFC